MDRLKLLLMPLKHQPDFIYLRHVPLRRVHLFTFLQVVCLALLWILKSTVAAIIFPVMVGDALLHVPHCDHSLLLPCLCSLEMCKSSLSLWSLWLRAPLTARGQCARGCLYINPLEKNEPGKLIFSQEGVVNVDCSWLPRLDLLWFLLELHGRRRGASFFCYSPDTPFKKQN